MKTKNLHFGLLTAILAIFVAMAAVPTVIAEVTWSAEAALYRDSVLPCVMDNSVKMGMPAPVVPSAICVVETGATNIAVATDMVVDVVDLRAAQLAYNYNFGMLGNNLTVVCEYQYELELGTLTPPPGKYLDNCLDGTGISPIDCTTLVPWVVFNAEVIDAAMESAGAICDVTWNPNRPISGAPECYVLSVVPPARAELNQTFIVNITMNLILSMILQDFEFKLWYNPALINATDVVPGPALAADYTKTVKNMTVPGRVWYGCSNLTTPPTLNISDTETLATINFTALEAGTSLLHLDETVLHTIVDTTPVEQGHVTQDADIRVVLPGTPVASFTYTPTDPAVDETVTFDASASYDPDGNLTDPDSYVWDFGDETTGTGMTVDHTYTTMGNYTVVLNVTDSEGLWDTESKSITVAAAPEPEFPWLWVAVVVVIIVAVAAVAVAIAVRRRK